MNKNIEVKENFNKKLIGVRNVKVDYLYCFIKNFDISSAIWVLYMIYKGLPLWQIGIVEGIFHVASFLFEVPSGAVADLFGRKKVMIAGRIFSALSAVINLFASNIFAFSIGFIISALGYNLNSGSEEALVYDSMKQSKCEKDYLKVNSRLNLLIEIAQGLATFIGGVLAEYSYVWCYIVVIIISILALIVCMFFQEPDIKNNKTEYTSFSEHFNICLKVLKSDMKIINILLYYPIIFTFDAVVFFYGQQYFNIAGCNKIQISLIMLYSGLLSCMGAVTCEKVIAIFKENTKYAASVLMGVSIIFISVNNIAVSIVFFGIMSYANALLYPIQSDSLNKLIPSEQRATIISIDSMLFSLSMICIFPICGLLADKFSLNKIFFILGIIQLCLIGSLYINALC